MTKKKDDEYIPLKSREELLDSLVNSKISLNELD
jgi:predicted alpha/beta hydrolase